jgi:hypothetical protein
MPCALRPPVPLEVIVDEESRRPRSVKALESREENGRKLDLSGEVRIASGPWRLEEGWWTDTPSMREYWDARGAGSLDTSSVPAISDRSGCDDRP